MRDVLLMKQLAIDAAMSPKNTVGLPPSNKGVMNVAEYPSQEFVMLNPKARVDNSENCRGISCASYSGGETTWSSLPLLVLMASGDLDTEWSMGPVHAYGIMIRRGDRIEIQQNMR